MMQDGMSTTQTLGHGLGAIRRFSDDFGIYSQRNWGTIVLSRIFLKSREKKIHKPFLSLQSLVIAKPGERGHEWLLQHNGRGRDG